MLPIGQKWRVQVVCSYLQQALVQEPLLVVFLQVDIIGQPLMMLVEMHTI